MTRRFAQHALPGLALLFLIGCASTERDGDDYAAAVRAISVEGGAAVQFEYGSDHAARQLVIYRSRVGAPESAEPQRVATVPRTHLRSYSFVDRTFDSAPEAEYVYRVVAGSESPSGRTIVERELESSPVHVTPSLEARLRFALEERAVTRVVLVERSDHWASSEDCYGGSNPEEWSEFAREFNRARGTLGEQQTAYLTSRFERCRRREVADYYAIERFRIRTVREVEIRLALDAETSANSSRGRRSDSAWSGSSIELSTVEVEARTY